MDRYSTNSKGTSPALSEILNQFQKMPKSAFDETRRKSFDASPYAIIPVECFLMFPNSDGYLRYDVQAITKNPTIKRILSSMSVELRTYKCKCSDLWEGWNNFITRGRSGKLNLKIPNINFIHTGSDSVVRNTSWPYNPYHYLNISPAVYFDKSQDITHNQGISHPSRTVSIDGQSVQMVDKTGLLGSSFNISSSDAYNKGQSALPGVMYCKIVKEYQNPNLLQDNPYWYPENENHDLILPYSCTEARTATYDYPNAQFETTVDGNGLYYIKPTNDKHSMPWLNVLYYKQRKGNYFNTGSPFPDLLRGDIPTIEVLNASINWDNVLNNTGTALLGDYFVGANTSNKVLIGTDDELNETLTNTANLKEALSKATISGIEFSMRKWREVATLTVFRERMARTDGSYNQMIEAQFQYNPKWHEHSVVYCGGSYQPIVFSEVVQQSADSSTPLGTTAGRAVTSSTSNEIHVHSDDYEILMTVMTITPDDYLSQGIDRMWSELTQSEQYFPILNNLNPQAIKNKELFISGTDSTDEDVFNYQELFSHFKSRQNQVSGLMALPISKVGDTGAYIFNRLFTSTPQFNNSFVTGQLTSNEQLCFASTEQAQFVFSVVSQFKYIAPMPAVTQASDMGLSY